MERGNGGPGFYDCGGARFSSVGPCISIHFSLFVKPTEARFRYETDLCKYKIISNAGNGGKKTQYPQVELKPFYAPQLLVIHLQQYQSDLPHFHELATDDDDDAQVYLSVLLSYAATF